jgi:hypothetical protein
MRSLRGKFRDPSNQPTFDDDGCDLGFLGTLLGIITGGLFAEASGAVLGGIVGHHEGESFDESINEMIAAGIANYLLSLRLSWHAQL